MRRVWKYQKNYGFVGTAVAVGHGKACCARNVSIKRRKVLEKRRIFVPYVEAKWG